MCTYVLGLWVRPRPIIMQKDRLGLGRADHTLSIRVWGVGEKVQAKRAKKKILLAPAVSQECTYRCYNVQVPSLQSFRKRKPPGQGSRGPRPPKALNPKP